MSVNKKQHVPGPVLRTIPELDQVLAVIDTATRQLTLNASGSRDQLTRGGGVLARAGFKRDIDKEAGYATKLDSEIFYAWYERKGIASRIVDIWPDLSWQECPEVYEHEDVEVNTPWEAAFEELSNRFDFHELLHRFDKLMGIGRFGIIVAGVSNSGESLAEPIEKVYDVKTRRWKPAGANNRDLLYLMPFAENNVRIHSMVTDPTNPRYGWPEFYVVTMAAPTVGDVYATTTTQIHWSRVFHFSDGRLSSEVFGIERLRQPFDYLYDLQKVASSAGEGYWQNGNPLLNIKTQGAPPPGVTIDTAGTKEQVWKLQNSLQKFLQLVGMEAEMLSPDIKDPAQFFDLFITLIAASIKVPKRILLGTEEAQLAGAQDSNHLSESVRGRRRKHCTKLVKEFVFWLMSLGVLEWLDSVNVDWDDAETMSEKEKADILKTKTDALVAYAGSQEARTIMTEAQYFEKVWNMDKADVEMIITAMEAAMAELDSSVNDPVTTPGMDPNADPNLADNNPNDQNPTQD